MKTPSSTLLPFRMCTALLPLLAIVLASPDAGAFCRTTTSRSSTAEEGGCATEGKALYHPLAKLSYRIVPSEPTIPTAILAEKMAKAFEHWTSRNARCTPGISVEVLPPAAKSVPTIAGFDRRGGNANDFGISSIPSYGSSEQLAMATLHFNSATGVILDVDLEIDTKPKWSFTEEAPPADGTDLEAILTHNAGHVLGLAHSDVPTSVMFPTYEPGSIAQRTLDPDDIEAICTIYPSREQRLSATGLVATSTCSSPLEDPAAGCTVPETSAGSDGCSAAPPSGGGLAVPGVALLLGLAAAVRRRRALR